MKSHKGHNVGTPGKITQIAMDGEKLLHTCSNTLQMQLYLTSQMAKVVCFSGISFSFELGIVSKNRF